MAYRKEKEAAEKLKFEQMQESIKAESNNQSIDELKKMDLDPQEIQKFESSLQNVTKTKAAEIQGQYYETYD